MPTVELTREGVARYARSKHWDRVHASLSDSFGRTTERVWVRWHKDGRFHSAVHTGGERVDHLRTESEAATVLAGWLAAAPPTSGSGGGGAPPG